MRKPWILAIVAFSTFPHPVITMCTSEVRSSPSLLNLSLISLLELGVVLPLFIIWLYALEGLGSRSLYTLPLSRWQVFLSKYVLYTTVCLMINTPIVAYSVISGCGLAYYLVVFTLTLISFSSLYNFFICKLLPREGSGWTFQSVGWLKLIPIMVISESVFIYILLESLNGLSVDTKVLYFAFSLADVLVLLL